VYRRVLQYAAGHQDFGANIAMCLGCLPCLQSFGAGNITVISPRSTLITGPIEINVPIEDGRTGAPGNQPLYGLAQCLVLMRVPHAMKAPTAVVLRQLHDAALVDAVICLLWSPVLGYMVIP
jgi:hypothetical protein